MNHKKELLWSRGVGFGFEVPTPPEMLGSVWQPSFLPMCGLVEKSGDWTT